MKINHSIPLLLLYICTIMTVMARENTTQSQVFVQKSNKVELENFALIDTTENTLKGKFNGDAISIMGFDKQASEYREVFFVKNNTVFAISRVKIVLRYSDVDGKMLHQRVELIDCEIPAGETRQLSISSFDRQRAFYYYLSSKPRKQSIPFKVSFKLLRYDIMVER